MAHEAQALRLSENNRGLSLLEVMVSVGILAAGIVFVLQALSFCAKSAGVVADNVQAVFLAEDLLQRLEYEAGSTGISQQEAGDRLGKFLWSYRISADPDLKLWELKLGLNWESSRRKDNLILTTYLKNGS
jgi:prepilin-type N-terminal cleavage/methylation domain-containing protein